MKIRVKCGFRYDVEVAMDVKEGWEKLIEQDIETFPTEMKKYLDSEFGAEGVVSDPEITYRVEEEE